MFPPPSSGFVGFSSLFSIPPIKPRNRSEWRDRFINWRVPASRSEEEKIESAKRAIQRAVDGDDWLRQRGYEIIKQGSYHNNTNVRNHSDVDLVVCAGNSYFFDGEQGEVVTREDLGFTPLGFDFRDFKAHLTKVLADRFGLGAVKADNKAIKLHGNDDEKVDADVVPAYRHNLYFPKSQWYGGRPALRAVGIAFRSDGGKMVHNFPEQHYANGVAKNERVSRRFKRVVRIIKRLRAHMAENGVPSEIFVSSFLLECLVYNCPDSDFASDDLYECVRQVLLSLAFDLAKPGVVNTYTEINAIKYLFGPHQPWTLEQARAFVFSAYAYVEFKA